MKEAPTANSAATVDITRSGERTVVRLAGDLTLASAGGLWERISEDLPSGPAAVDVTNVGRCDSAGALLLLALRERAGSVEVVGANAQVASVLRLAERVPPAAAPAAPPKRRGLRESAADAAISLAASVRATLLYIGELTASLGAAVMHPGSVRWRDTISCMVRVGSDALGIVSVVGFLIGWTLAFQGAAQLGRFGIASYTADAVGASLLVELGPLMTAIIVAGRSGSAFAAEIGTMKVNEEVDALDTMGLDRTRFLVAPKVIALLLMFPLLVLFANACGIFGGLLVGVSSLDMTAGVYLRRTADSVGLWSFAQGMIKGSAYSLVIAAVGCLRGLQTKVGAQGVGLSTTSAVVTSILLVLIVDAVLTAVFFLVG